MCCVVSVVDYSSWVVCVMECCRVDDTSPECGAVIRSTPVTWASARWYVGVVSLLDIFSTDVVAWWKWHTDDSLVILFGICSCHVPEEAEPSPFSNRRDWRATTCLQLPSCCWHIAYVFCIVCRDLLLMQCVGCHTKCRRMVSHCIRCGLPEGFFLIFVNCGL